jgi:hypothetical protein
MKTSLVVYAVGTRFGISKSRYSGASTVADSGDAGPPVGCGVVQGEDTVTGKDSGDSDGIRACGDGSEATTMLQMRIIISMFSSMSSRTAT